MKILDLLIEPVVCREDFNAPYIIAEAGVNHEGDLNLAMRLIDEASEGGADAIKFQSYKADTIASKHSPAYWDLSQESTTSQYELFKKHDKFWKTEFETLKKYCDSVGIEFMSTPFDTESATFLNDMMDVYKISSSDLTNKPFIEFIADFQKPIILSTGASNLNEIRESVSWIEESGVKFALLHCVLNYPTDDENANLAMIKDLQKHFPGIRVGYSDHTLPKDMKTLEVATLLGASIIEKHFTHDKTLPGNDHYHAMDMHDLRYFKDQLTRIETLFGSFTKQALESETLARNNARRSLVAAHYIPQGATITEADLTWKRPAHGISPAEIDKVVGMRTQNDVAADELLQWEMLG